jgi:hypothetical protein
MTTTTTTMTTIRLDGPGECLGTVTEVR